MTEPFCNLAGPCGAFQGQSPPHVLCLPLVLEKLQSSRGLPLSHKSLAQELIIEGVPIVAHRVWNLTSIHEDAGSIPGLNE